MKDCLAHVHISENDRSTPGQGNVRWDETFDALHEIGYDGLMVIEAFGLALESSSRPRISGGGCTTTSGSWPATD